MYASHIAAMAPATNIGSSTPVSIGGEGSPFPSPGGSSEPRSRGNNVADKTDTSGDEPPNEPDRSRQPVTTMERKVINDAVAYIRGLAELRGRNKDWAEKTVREAVESAGVGSARGARDRSDRDRSRRSAAPNSTAAKITVDGGTVTLDLKGAEVTRVNPGWRYQLAVA